MKIKNVYNVLIFIISLVIIFNLFNQFTYFNNKNRFLKTLNDRGIVVKKEEVEYEKYRVFLRNTDVFIIRNQKYGEIYETFVDDEIREYYKNNKKFALFLEKILRKNIEKEYIHSNYNLNELDKNKFNIKVVYIYKCLDEFEYYTGEISKDKNGLYKFNNKENFCIIDKFKKLNKEKIELEKIDFNLINKSNLVKAFVITVIDEKIKEEDLINLNNNLSKRYKDDIFIFVL
ncbi:hypothetical protein [Streptobacillus canis]|uniref:hypothetical protein n=1 Tax=Streptobacillus canis TaxID=2678686 RepID=UPI0012E0EE88|nr:hypothetical protein [Streptobacillus canis]